MQYLSLLGGEPFLHPELDQLVSIFRQMSPNTGLQILTGGIFKPELLDGISQDDLGLIFNINEPRDYRNRASFDLVVNNIENAIRRGFKVLLGFNVWRIDFDTKFMSELASRLGRNSFRWTVANPQWSQQTCVVAPGQYRILAQKCMEMLRNAAQLSIEAMVDCPLPLCFFDEKELAWVRQYHSGTSSRMGVCQPVIDVTPELEAIRCFALSKTTRVNLLDYPSEWALSEWFRKHIDAQMLSSGCFILCTGCPHFASGRCSGGCLAWHNCNFEAGVESPSSKLARAMYSEIEIGNFAAALMLFDKSAFWTKSDLSFYLAAVASKQLGNAELAFKYASAAQDMTVDQEIKRRVLLLLQEIHRGDEKTEKKPEKKSNIGFIKLPLDG